MVFQLTILAIYLREKEKRFVSKGFVGNSFVTYWCGKLGGDTHLSAYIYSRLVFLEKRSEGIKSRFRNLCTNQYLNSQSPIVHQHYIREDWWLWMSSRAE